MSSDATTRSVQLLQNSGPDTREVFRCPALGTLQRLDLFSALLCCDVVPRDQFYAVLRAADDTLPTPPPMIARIPAENVEAIGLVVLGALGVASSPPSGSCPTERAQEVLRRVVALVKERGWHTTRLGIATHVELDPATWRDRERIGCDRVSVAFLAFTLAAFSVYSPPLLLWTREPSLDWLRVDIHLGLRSLWGAGGSL